MLAVAIRDTLTLEQRHAQTLSELRQRDAHVQTAEDECVRCDAAIGDDDDCVACCFSNSAFTQTEQDAREEELESLKEYYELELDKQRSQHEMQLFRLKDEQIMRILHMKDEIDRVRYALLHFSLSPSFLFTKSTLPNRRFLAFLFIFHRSFQVSH